MTALDGIDPREPRAPRIGTENLPADACLPPMRRIRALFTDT
jgi:hypothetical protein